MSEKLAYSDCDEMHPVKLAVLCLMTSLSFIAEHLMNDGKPEIDPKDVLITTLQGLKEKEMLENKSNPGSKEAKEQGCKCPVLDNCYGRGLGGDGEQFGFVIHEDCPIHGRAGKDGE